MISRLPPGDNLPVAIHGLAPARRLGLTKARPDGILCLGGEAWIRKIARLIRDEDFPVMLADDNRRHTYIERAHGRHPGHPANP